MSKFKDQDEFKRVFEQIFQLMNEHPEVGRTLRDAQAPHRFEITDMGLSSTSRPRRRPRRRRGGMKWVWGTCDWEPLIQMKMASDVANRYFQGKENIMLAVAMGRAKLGGPMSTLLKLAPVTTPIHPVYREWLKAEGLDHLLA